MHMVLKSGKMNFHAHTGNNGNFEILFCLVFFFFFFNFSAKKEIVIKMNLFSKF